MGVRYSRRRLGEIPPQLGFLVPVAFEAESRSGVRPVLHDPPAQLRPYRIPALARHHHLLAGLPRTRPSIRTGTSPQARTTAVSSKRHLMLDDEFTCTVPDVNDSCDQSQGSRTGRVLSVSGCRILRKPERRRLEIGFGPQQVLDQSRMADDQEVDTRVALFVPGKQRYGDR